MQVVDLYIRVSTDEQAQFKGDIDGEDYKRGKVNCDTDINLLGEILVIQQIKTQQGSKDIATGNVFFKSP